MIAESKAFKFLGLSKLFVVLLLATNLGLFYVFIKYIAPSYNILVNVYMQFFALGIIVAYVMVLVSVVRPLYFPFSQGMMALFFTLTMMLFALLMGAQFCLVDGLNFMAKISGGRLPYLAPVVLLLIFVVVLATAYEVSERRGWLRLQSLVTVVAFVPFVYLASKSLYLYYASLYYSDLLVYIPYYVGVGVMGLMSLLSLALLFASPRFALGRFQSKVQSSKPMRLFYIFLALYSLALALFQFTIFSVVFLLAAIFFMYIYLRPMGLSSEYSSLDAESRSREFWAALWRLYAVNIVALTAYIALNMFVFYFILDYTLALFAENMIIMGILMIIVVPLYPLALRIFRSL